MSQPWMKFYPRDWRGDQALRVVSLAARGLWMEMLCIMHEASPRGHLLIGAKPVTDEALARSIGSGTAEVQALLVELRNAGVFDRSRNGVILSRRMISDEKKANLCRLAKLEAIEKANGNQRPSRSPSGSPYPQKPEARAKSEGPYRPSDLSEAKYRFLGPDEVRQAFVDAKGEAWTGSYVDPCTWQDVPERALIPHTNVAGRKIVSEARAVLISLNLTVLERSVA